MPIRTRTDLILTAHPDFDPGEGLIAVRPDVVIGLGGGPADAAFSVAVSDLQRVVGFPKFGTIGIGFAVEDDGNTNLPYSSPPDEIADHIGHNRGAAGDDPSSISHELVVAAITMIRDAVGALPDYGVRCAWCSHARVLRDGDGAHWAEACPIGPEPDGYFTRKAAKRAAAPRDPQGWLIRDDEADQ